MNGTEIILGESGQGVKEKETLKIEENDAKIFGVGVKGSKLV